MSQIKFMDLLRVLLFLFLSFPPFFIYGVEGRNLNMSKIKDLELERQLKLLNKQAVKSIHTENGDIYDCVDFYKQPAFDHPEAKNFTSRIKMEHDSLYNGTGSEFFVDEGLRVGEGCPLGTVLIKRTTKEDLIKEGDLQLRSKQPSNFKSFHYAVIRTTNSPYNFGGAAAVFTVWNPQATFEQYSESRMIIQRGSDIIQVGWRVDPFLTGDEKTHFFVHTQTGNSSCFSTKCPGFVLTSKDMTLDGYFKNISTRGGTIFSFQIDILRDANGDWRLRYGPNDKKELGYWPSYIFGEYGLQQVADYIEWGGEVYSRPNVVKPPMGSGNFPYADPEQSSSIRRMTFRDEDGRKMDAEFVEPYADSPDFKVIEIPLSSLTSTHRVYFGGPGGNL